MAHICGTVEEAKQLQNLLRMTLQAIDSGTTELQNECRNAMDIVRDERASVIEEICNQIKSGLSEAMESAAAVEKSLDAYIEVLRS